MAHGLDGLLHAEVSVWFVVVKSSAAIPPAAVWHTTRVSVTRTPVGWRAEAETTVDGPNPASDPSVAPPDPAVYSDQLAGFDPVPGP